jgi:hypothetical protein
MIIGVHYHGQGLLTDAIDARGLAALFFGLGQSWEDHCRQYRDHGNDDEKLNQAKSRFAVVRAQFVMGANHRPEISTAANGTKIEIAKTSGPHLQTVPAVWCQDLPLGCEHGHDVEAGFGGAIDVNRRGISSAGEDGIGGGT